MPLFTPFGVSNVPPKKSKRVRLDRPIAERSFMLFRRDGTPVPVTVRLGTPFIGKAAKLGARPEYSCAVQILGIGDERVTAPSGEDAFVALQYAIDLVGEKLDGFVRRENLQIRFTSGKHRKKWIWRFPPD